MLYKTSKRESGFSLGDIAQLLNLLLDKYDEETQSKSQIFKHKHEKSFSKNPTPDGDADGDIDSINFFKRPYKQLLIWALLMNR